jgi:hypothetical protein
MIIMRRKRDAACFVARKRGQSLERSSIEKKASSRD